MKIVGFKYKQFTLDLLAQIFEGENAMFLKNRHIR